jgi:EAL domain-containing protein (putative c-di-GMP-specific phosphodiesterase class I)
MNGLELVRTLRSFDPDVPIILMTGAPTIDSAVEAVEHGVSKYLRKPFELDELERAVTRATQLRRLANAKREALAMLGTSSGEGYDRVELAAAFDRMIGGLWMAFQPIVRAEDHTLFAYEALLRSSEPALPNPGAVLEAAERLSELDRLGRAIRERTAVAAETAPPGALLFINLHPSDLGDADLANPDSTLGTMASRVVLEVTERSALDSVNDVRAKVARLRKIGYRLAVDDLGAGYAGLTSFVQLEPEFVKLDMSLVRDVDKNERKQKLVKSMTSLCRDMGLLVVGEGVETEAERDELVELGCDLLQGYRFGKPRGEFAAPVW